ncbi:PQQ-like beta-propeller repeat protein [Saccharicrinis aurantiacus]|uniref:PQQ-like beta-propeller repeat protein n=1 Tax=Saccharicrinis aurantiacus TaxID=1849719 RepID=UPI0009FB1373|nr:PQQ-like beta-propeller repeat protein [Saccharicrinis aurantiacus]
MNRFYKIIMLLFFQGAILSSALSTISASKTATAPKMKSALLSFDTGLTISKVAMAKNGNTDVIVTSSYKGIITALDYSGKILWTNDIGKGIMNYDIWCDDITANGKTEILLAAADGNVHCLSIDGTLQWSFHPTDMPMVSVCSITKSDGSKYIACGGNDLNLYYINSKGELLNTIPSNTYPTPLKMTKKWQGDAIVMPNAHSVNFLRPLPQADGTDVLLMNAIVGHADQKSLCYYFKPMAAKPHKTFQIGYGHGPIGDFRVRRANENADYEILIGTSGIGKTLNFTQYIPTQHKNNKQLKTFNIEKALGRSFGYKVVQTEMIENGNTHQYFIKCGADIFITDADMNEKSAEHIQNTYSYNDMCLDKANQRIILASAQSGGSCVHVIDLKNKAWKKQFKSIAPPGKIQQIVDNSAHLKKQLNKFKAPTWERDPLNVYLMSPPKEPKAAIDNIKNNYNSPVFMGYAFTKQVSTWDRSALTNESFKNARDSRKSYSISATQLENKLIKGYNENGLTTWGGHGVDPFYYGTESIKRVIDAGNGKKSIWVWPEITILYKDQYDYVTKNLLYPLAEYGQENNAMIYLRSKHLFWQSIIYKPEWKRFLSGEFADAFLPGMEETQDMTMELSLASRLGLWTSGVSNSWVTRCARDNPSYLRTRQFSNQNLPNHFLRNAVYHASYGAEYVNNFALKGEGSEYMSIFWELIAKGAIYVPKRSEILSFSPVHLSITNPDKRYMSEGNGSTALTRYDKDFHPYNPYVFTNLTGDWAGARLKEYDFSRYAAGVVDHRLHFLAPYNNGMVLITPVQNGAFADEDAPRGKMVDNLHPFYKDKMVEYVTNGRNYISADGKETLAADEYYKNVENSIKDGAKTLPIIVEGEVAWVVAQTSPMHLRLTLIDGGYINPDDRNATVTFNTITPVKITDVVDGKTYKVNKAGKTIIDIPCGLFRFIDVELSEPFIE